MKTSSSDGSTARTSASASTGRIAVAKASTAAVPRWPAGRAAGRRTCGRRPRRRVRRPRPPQRGRLRRHHFDEAARQLLPKAPGLVHRQHLPFVHQRNARTPLRFIEVGRGHHDGDAARQELRQQLPELPARDGIDTGRRLVQHDERRLVDERARQRQLLFHPARELAGQAVAERREPRHLQELLAARAVVADAVQLGEELDVLVDGQVAVQREALGQVAHALRHLGALADRDRRPARAPCRRPGATGRTAAGSRWSCRRRRAR